MTSKWLELALALRASLKRHLPALVEEVNLSKRTLDDPDNFIVMPDTVRLGVDTSMLEVPLENLPAILCGVYERETMDGIEQIQQDVSIVIFPFVIECYLGEREAEACYIKALKWATVMDLFVERYGSRILDGYESPEAPDVAVTYTLQLRDRTFRQLVTTTGVLVAAE